MFEPITKPCVFALPPGADFPQGLVDGLLARLEDAPPHELARVEVFVNTRRMHRRIQEIFQNGPARLLPRLRIVSDIGRDAVIEGLPAQVSSLCRRLELRQLVVRLIEAEPDIAPKAGAFDLADSLANLLDEIQGEGVSPNALREIDVSDHSAHWARSLKFVSIVQEYLRNSANGAPDPEARQRLAVMQLVASWDASPPDHPIIVAGSTGSRGTTALLMEAVAKLPLGAVVLPGFDFDMPRPVWDTLGNGLTSEDHPQYRFARLLAQLDLQPDEVTQWHATEAPAADRNRVVSLALRPAPVTDQWLSEGKSLADLTKATQGLTLIEAANERAEAVAIALVLRDANARGMKAALISPDRMLGRRVTAILDRWGIEPDDSAGRPLSLSAPGRLLQHVASLSWQKVTTELLLILLKHPLASTGSERGTHLLNTRELELWLRKTGAPFPDKRLLLAWADGRKTESAVSWSKWVVDTLLGDQRNELREVSDHLADILRIAEALSCGPDGQGSGELWKETAGEKARQVVDALASDADAGGLLDATEFASLLRSVLDREDVRDPVRPYPDVMIWGTLEARVQGADLVIMGGLNEGTWPGAPAPDPWLNRKMRHDAGLPLPDRQIGLAAHDFQQAIGASRVVLTRPLRADGVEPVPSRWLNRLTNLLDGLPDQNGTDALRGMRERGGYWIGQAEKLDHDIVSIPAESRPSPRPPITLRPNSLSVTQVQKLIRDPYAIYASEILRLPVVRPLKQAADAPLRGEVLHRIFDRFVSNPAHDDRERLLEIAREELEKGAPWATARRLWMARIERVADWFISLEQNERQDAECVATEEKGSISFDEIGFTLRGRADRVDRLDNGRLAILDYKTGSPPTLAVVEHYDKQLLLEAIMAEGGAFKDLPTETVEYVAYIGLGASPKYVTIPLENDEKHRFETRSVKDGLFRLIRAYQRPAQGYTSRRAMHKMRFEGDYDHLARFGEWDDSNEPVGVDVE